MSFGIRDLIVFAVIAGLIFVGTRAHAAVIIDVHSGARVNTYSTPVTQAYDACAAIVDPAQRGQCYAAVRGAGNGFAVFMGDR